jgi:ComF family protein
MGLPPRCYFCQAEGDLGPIDLCAQCCFELPWSSETAIGASSLSALAYRDPVDQALKSLKYRGDRCAARLFGGLLAAAVREAERPDVLIPVPLHPERLCSRGFNQSSLIATSVGDWLHRPVRLHWVSRTRATPSQTGLHAAERRRNVEDAFIVAPDLEQELDASGVRRVALIDDVVTTGATLDAVRNALLGAGVTDVQRWAVARAMPAKSTMPT